MPINALIQKFNAWTGGMSEISDVIASFLSQDEAQVSTVTSSPDISGAQLDPTYDSEDICPLTSS